MKTISTVVHDRPEYVIQFLETLKQNDLTGYKFFINLEPTAHQFAHLFEDIDWIETDIQYNTEKLGPYGNFYDVINRAFKAGSEFNLMFDSDLVIAKDATQLANFYYDNFKDDPWKYNSYSLFNYGSDPERPTEIRVLHEYFMGLGWCIFPEHWEVYKEIWYDNTLSHKWFTPQTNGWDWEMSAYAKEHKIDALFPAYSRTNHIGENGTYCTPEWQEKSFNHLMWNKEEFYTDFHIVVEDK